MVRETKYMYGTLDPIIGLYWDQTDSTTTSIHLNFLLAIWKDLADMHTYNKARCKHETSQPEGCLC